MTDWPARMPEHTPAVTGRPDEPWWTRDAITWLDQHLTKQMDVIEWGAGSSTVWLAQRVRSVLAIEHDPDWALTVRVALAAAGFGLRAPYGVVCYPLGPAYYRAHWPAADVVIVDGRLRVFCCESGMRLLRSGGWLVLDDAQRREYAEVHELLAGWPVRRLTDGVPGDDGEWCTTIWTKP